MWEQHSKALQKNKNTQQNDMLHTYNNDFDFLPYNMSCTTESLLGAIIRYG